MRLVSYQYKEETCLGVLFESLVVDLERAQRVCVDKNSLIDEHSVSEVRVPNSMKELLAGGQREMALVQRTIDCIQVQFEPDQLSSSMAAFSQPLEDVSLSPPVVAPGKIICVGMNYPPPGDPGPPPRYPVLFLKAASTLTGHNGSIQLPRVSQDVFCEGELAVVIGRRGKHIPQEQVLSYVAGYTIADDVGARDLEARASQWATGKLPDTFNPMGPALVTRDEVPHPNALEIKTYLNERLVQHGNTRDMIFDVPYLIHYLSGITTLEPGDIILTGSPKAIGEIPAPNVSLKPGDTIEIEIEKLGVLTNTCVAEE